MLAKQGLLVPVSDLFGVGGRDRLTRLELPAVYRARVDALCRLIDAYDFEVDAVGSQLRGRLAAHAGYQAIQAVPGVGPVLAAVFVAEIGEVDRFTGPAKLCCWAGLTPRHRESDTTIRRGSITKQGSVLVRWAAIEAVQKLPASAGWLVTNRARIAERRGRNIATVAVARKLLTLVYYGLRDGHIRALARPQAAAGRCRRRTGRTAAAVRPPRRTRRRPHPPHGQPAAPVGRRARRAEPPRLAEQHYRLAAGTARVRGAVRRRRSREGARRPAGPARPAEACRCWQSSLTELAGIGAPRRRRYGPGCGPGPAPTIRTGWACNVASTPPHQRVTTASLTKAMAASAIRQALTVMAPSLSRSCSTVISSPPVPHRTPAPHTWSRPMPERWCTGPVRFLRAPT